VNREASFSGWDGKEYYAYAQSILSLQWDNYPRYFNSIRPIGYPLFLIPFVAISRSVWPIQIAQALLGILQALVLSKIASHWCGRRAGDFALVLALFHPFLIYYCGFILTETVFLTLLWSGILFLLFFITRGSIGWLIAAAIVLALGCLTRPTLQPFLIVSVLWIALFAKTRSLWTVIRNVCYFTLIVSAILLPIMIHNTIKHHDFTLAPGGGQSMYAMSNSADYLRMYEAQTKAEYYEVFERLVRHVSLESGISNDRLLEEARGFRQDHRKDWWRLQAYKFKHFWTPWLDPRIFSRSQFLLSLFSTTPLFAVAAVFLWRRRRQKDPFLILLLGLVAVGYLVGGCLFHVQVRYRIPFVDVTFLILSASMLGKFSLTRLTRESAAARTAACFHDGLAY
jgi:Dolichyl-phosphate-mannose-protein mannosyltransferase